MKQLLNWKPDRADMAKLDELIPKSTGVGNMMLNCYDSFTNMRSTILMPLARNSY